MASSLSTPVGRMLRWRGAPHVVPTVVTLVWLGYVIATGEFGRALDRWPSTVTMALGSFLAGASPLGGGAAAFLLGG